MKARPIRFAVLAAVIALLAVLATRPPGPQGVVRAQAPATKTFTFNAYFSIGDSLAAGYESGSLVETHQANSVPAHIARQAQAADFQQPLISEPGIPPETAIVTLLPVRLQPKAATPGAPKNLNLARAYNNLAVPGAASLDALSRTGGDIYSDLILRGRGSQVAQAAAARPTVVTLWIGNNDVLGAAVRGRVIEGVTITPSATFRTIYQQIVSALVASGATVVAANLPDVTTIPFVTTIPPVVVNPTTGQPVLINNQPVPLIGPNGPLPTGTFVTLAASQFLAQGDGIPTALGGRGTALTDEVILDPAEVASIRDHVNANNQAIREICQAAGVPVLDLFTLLNTIHDQGINVGGVTLTGAFLTGGIFSYDGIHPSDLGYAVTANEWIRVMNANGAQIPEINLAPFLGFASSASGRRGTTQGAATTRAPWFEFSKESYQDLLAAFPRLDGR